jgi:lipoic acid synthetase
MNSRLPSWFRQEIPHAETLESTRLLYKFNLHTVCKEAGCPNISRCLNNRKLTFMILGTSCTRHCRFCGVGKSISAGLSVDENEPYRITSAVSMLGLSYVVITSVTRDDLLDGGSGQFVRVIESLRCLDSKIKVEVLVPDFSGSRSSLESLIDAAPDVLAHNIETVRDLHRQLKPDSNYRVSLLLLRMSKDINPRIITKSSLLLGLGETASQVRASMEDLRSVGCDILTLGQYLAPSEKHYPAREFIHPEKFAYYRDEGMRLGFKSVFSGPLVRSSYQAQELYEEVSHA